MKNSSTYQRPQENQAEDAFIAFTYHFLFLFPALFKSVDVDSGSLVGMIGKGVEDCQGCGKCPMY